MYKRSLPEEQSKGIRLPQELPVNNVITVSSSPKRFIVVLIAVALNEYQASYGGVEEPISAPHITIGEELFTVARVLSKQNTLEAGVLQLAGVESVKGQAIEQSSGNPAGQEGLVPEHGGIGEHEIAAAHPALVIEPSEVKRTVIQP
jgi:hypothetical protein